MLFFLTSCYKTGTLHEKVNKSNRISNDDLNVVFNSQRIIKCDSLSQVVSQSRDLYDIDKNLINCILESHFCDPSFDIDDIVFILDNIDHRRIKYIFPHKKMRGQELFLHVVKLADNFDGYVENKEREYYVTSHGMLKTYYSSMIKDWNGLNFNEYCAWYFNKDSETNKKEMEWVVQRSNIKDETLYHLVTIKKEYEYLKYAIENKHINLKDYCEE